MFEDRLWRWIGCGGLALVAPMVFAQDPAPASAPDTAAPAQAQPVDPAQPDDATAQSPAAAEEAARLEREARQDQLAAARHLAQELDRTLNEQGLITQRNYSRDPATTAQAPASTPAQIRAKLTELATRAGLLLRSTAVPAARFTLLQTQARIYNALAQDAAARGEELDTTRRLRQLRSTGQWLRQLDRPEADATGSYWVLLADLADTNRTDAPVEARQALAREVLSAYIDQFAEDPSGADLVLDARLALARLLDQAGNQTRVAEQLAAIGTVDRADPRRRELELLQASVARIGRAVELDLATTRGLRWRLGEHGDGPVLVHIFADGSVGNAEMIQGLMEKIARSARGGFTVVSLRVGPEVKGGAAAAWPTLLATGQERQVLEQFGITSAPTLVWLDARGQIAAVGQTLEVFDRLPLAPAQPIDLSRRPEADPPVEDDQPEQTQPQADPPAAPDADTAPDTDKPAAPAAE